MKTSLFVLCFLFASISLSAQDYSNLSQIELKKAEDYSLQESKVEESTDFILSQPYKINQQNKLYCIQYILKWMEGTPDHTFNIGEDFVNFCGNDTELSTVYLASLAKSAVDEGVMDKSSEGLSSNAKGVFLDYCEKPENKVKKNRAIKKALKERNNSAQ
ncbi:MAG: hypothetical protein ABFS38_09190 [Bacteroidota bacterium]